MVGAALLRQQDVEVDVMFAGEGTPERTNRRFHYLSVGQPAARLSTAFDSVTLYGEDPAPRPDIYGKIGNSGVNIATLDDMRYEEDHHNAVLWAAYTDEEILAIEHALVAAIPPEKKALFVHSMYPSSIAAYGLPSLETKMRAGKVREDDWMQPTTMYGCNKLYCEQLGTYYARHYKQLAAERASGRVDFRCVRFPGLISAVTTPSGGTSDYAPEMIHAAAKGQPYSCFVRPDTRIPFMETLGS